MYERRSAQREALNDYFNEVFPRLAEKYNWSVQFNHCFRRIVYDTLFQDKWSNHIEGPVINNMTDIQVNDCLTICRSIVWKPDSIIELNNQSLKYRKRKHV